MHGTSYTTFTCFSTGRGSLTLVTYHGPESRSRSKHHSGGLCRETRRRLGTRLKEQKYACVRCQTDKSAIAEYASLEDHPINWSGTKILQRASHTMELVMKEALCIQSTPADSRFNRDSGYELYIYLTVGSH